MLRRCETVTIASVTEEGFPRPVPMSKIHAQGYAVVWLATARESLKTHDFTRNPKAGLCFSEGGDSVVLTGEVEVVTDRISRERYWQDWFGKHFAGGINDPSYVLLKFTGRYATIYIHDQFVRQEIKATN